MVKTKIEFTIEITFWSKVVRQKSYGPVYWWSLVWRGVSRCNEMSSAQDGSFRDWIKVGRSCHAPFVSVLLRFERGGVRAFNEEELPVEANLPTNDPYFESYQLTKSIIGLGVQCTKSKATIPKFHMFKCCLISFVLNCAKMVQMGSQTLFLMHVSK